MSAGGRQPDIAHPPAGPRFSAEPASPMFFDAGAAIVEQAASCPHAARMTDGLCGVCGDYEEPLPAFAQTPAPETDAEALEADDDALAAQERLTEQYREQAEKEQHRAEAAEQAFRILLDHFNRRPTSVPVQRSDHDVLDRFAQLLEETLAELKRSNSVERTGSVSSVEIKFLANGTPQPTVKRYAGSEAPVDEALDDYGRAFREAKRRAEGGWAETLEASRAQQAAD